MSRKRANEIMNKVESYAGSTYPEKPRALEWEGQRYQVQEIIQRSRHPDELAFLVRCSPGDRLFELLYNLIDDNWLINSKGYLQQSPNNTGE